MYVKIKAVGDGYIVKWKDCNGERGEDAFAQDEDELREDCFARIMQDLPDIFGMFGTKRDAARIVVEVLKPSNDGE